MILDGKNLAKQIKLDFKQLVLDKQIVGKVGLAFVLVGDDEASQIYVNNKVKACHSIGVRSFVHKFESNVREQTVSNLIDDLNADQNVHGILVQLPLPSHIDSQRIINKIKYDKDVDGLSQHNVFGLMKGLDCLIPCTPQGILKLIQTTNIDLVGKHAVVIGRSDIVGKPMSQLLLQSNCTVTVCHSKTSNLASLTKLADILIVAVGKKHLINRTHVKPNSIVIDVGINRVGDKLYGDVDFESVKDMVDWITPVPGGVGPMTIAMLISNVLKAGKVY